MKNDQRPVSQPTLSRQSRCLLRIFTVRQSLNYQTAAAKYFGRYNTTRQLTMKFAWQVASRFTQTQHDRLAAFVHFSAGVIERVHRHVCKDEQVRRRIKARERMLQQVRKIVQV